MHPGTHLGVNGTKVTVVRILGDVHVVVALVLASHLPINMTVLARSHPLEDGLEGKRRKRDD